MVSLFLDTKYSDNTIDDVFGKILHPKKNIILTGMPACGKSTVGKILSKKLGMSLFDSDALIEEKEGMTISDIFSQKGEEYFRDSESQVISDLGSKNGIIISTGGGAILREKNIYAMKQNGDVYFINRPLENLVPTDNRPLAKNVDAIKKRFEERYDIYTSTADVIIDASCNATEVAEKIAKDFLKQ
jgi:shikimate dehydrogenase